MSYATSADALLVETSRHRGHQLGPQQADMAQQSTKELTLAFRPNAAAVATGGIIFHAHQ